MSQAGVATAITLPTGVTMIGAPVISPKTFVSIANVAASSANNSTVVTGAIDTTGADLIVAIVGEYSVNAAAVLTDSKGNTWTALTSYQTSNQDKVTLWYSQPTTVGSGHTFTVTDAASTLPAIAVSAWSGSALIGVFDKQNGNTSPSGTTVAPGSIVPSYANALVITGFTAVSDGGSAPTVDSGFTLLANSLVTGVTSVSAAIACKITGTTASNPTWTNPTGASTAAAIASFRVVPPVVPPAPVAARAVLFGSGDDPYILVVNGLSQDIYIDKYGTARTLNVLAPIAAPTVTTGALTGPSGTLLTGVYSVAVTFKVKTASGALLLETGLSPISTGSPALATGSLAVNAMPVSSEQSVNSRGVYRTVSGGNVLYPWFDEDNNTTLSEDRGGADATLSILPTAASVNGLPPLLKLITTWKDILWGVPRANIDHVRWTEPRLFYTWSAANEILIPPVNTDTRGVTAFIPRRDQLGIARRDRLYQITGDGDDTFARIQVSPNIGCLSQESVVVIRDVAYFLGERGVVEWNAQSCGYISEAQVDPWFNTDQYFNRSLFSLAQGRYNPGTDAYELLLAGVGSSVLNMWVAFDLDLRAWYGPHLSALPLSCCASDSERHGYLRSSTELALAVFGTTTGFLEKRDETVADDDNLPVALDVQLPVLGAFAPELEKVWLDPTLHTRVEPAGSGPHTVTVTSAVGPVDKQGLVSDSAPIVNTADLTESYQRLDRPGTGRYVSFRFQHMAQGESVRIEGLEVPYGLIGRRDR